MICRQRMSALCLTAVLSTAPLLSQEKTLWLAGMYMTIGMPRDQVMGKLQGEYELVNASNEINYDQWMITDKDVLGNYKILGTIGFKKGLLSYVSKQWGTFRTPDALKMGEALLSLLGSIVERGDYLATVTVEQTAKEPDMTVRRIYFDFAGKQVIILVARSDKYGDQVGISEQLETIVESRLK